MKLQMQKNSVLKKEKSATVFTTDTQGNMLSVISGVLACSFFNVWHTARKSLQNEILFLPERGSDRIVQWMCSVLHFGKEECHRPCIGMPAGWIFALAVYFSNPGCPDPTEHRKSRKPWRRNRFLGRCLHRVGETIRSVRK